MTAVGAVVPVIAHHEVVALRHHLWPPVVVAAVLARDEGIVHRHVVAEHAAVDNADLIAFFRDHTLDERLLRVERVVQHHDVADVRLADAIRQLVHNQAVLIGQGGRHAQTLYPGDLEAEGHDERRVDRRGRERLQPGDNFLDDPAHAKGRRLGRDSDIRRYARESARHQGERLGRHHRLRRGEDLGSRRDRFRDGVALLQDGWGRRRVGVVVRLAHSVRASNTRGAAWSVTGSQGFRSPWRRAFSTGNCG